MVDAHTDAYPLVIFNWVTFGIATILVFARLYVQLRFRKKPWREVWVILAWLFYLGITVDDSILSDWDFFNSDVDYSTKSDAEVAPAYKAEFTWGLFYNNVLYCCKAALLCFYTDLAPREWFPKTWWLIVFTWVWVIIAAIVHTFYQLFQCGAPYVQWTQSIQQWDSGSCSPYQEGWSLFAGALHVYTDFLVYLIPFIILRNLKNITIGEKRGAYVMFALGLVNVGSAVLTYCYNLFLFESDWGKSWSEERWFNFDQAFTYLIPFQAGSAVIIVCLPYCRRLVKGTRERDIRPSLNTEALEAAHAAVQADIEHGSGSKDVYNEYKDHSTSMEESTSNHSGER